MTPACRATNWTLQLTSSPITYIPLIVPGAAGLNKEQESSVLGPEWATVARNAVFDRAGRLAARNGWNNQTTSPMSGTPSVEVLHEQITKSGTSTIISAAGSKLWSGVTSPTDITGTATVTVGNRWQFVNFGDSVYGFQQGEQPIVRSSGNFSDLTASSGTAPTGNTAVVHSGRVWAAGSDKQTIQYSALLDPTKWATADGAGSLDMTSVWPSGTDEIVSLTVYNGRMVVFGKNRIVFFGDGNGFPLGLNPSTLQVEDFIIGTGCIARDTVKAVESGDIFFLSNQGVQALSQVIQERSNPIANVSRNVRSYLINYIGGETVSNIRSVYSHQNGFYLVSFPTARIVFCFDTTSRQQDGSCRTTEWTDLSVRAFLNTLGQNLYFTTDAAGGGSSCKGKIGLFSGNLDAGMGYPFEYKSGWIDLGDGGQRFKMLKKINGAALVARTVDMSVGWEYDFVEDSVQESVLLTGPSPAEWGIMEWGLFEWGGSGAMKTFSVSCDGEGHYVRVKVKASIVDSPFSLQKLGLAMKVGRLSSE